MLDAAESRGDRHPVPEGAILDDFAYECHGEVGGGFVVHVAVIAAELIAVLEQPPG